MPITKPVIFSLFASSLFLTACTETTSTPTATTSGNTVTETVVKQSLPDRVITKDDKFTYSNYDEVRLTHIDLNLDVNFDAKVLDGIATLDFERVKLSADTLVLDIKDLLIKSVRLFDGARPLESVEYVIGDADPVLGQSLRYL